MAINLVVMIHGITTDTTPGSHKGEYDALYSALRQHLGVGVMVDLETCYVEWGHEPLGGPKRPDEYLTGAERYLAADTPTTQYDHRVGLNNPVSSLLLNPLLINPLKRIGMIHGAADALYYCSPDGERAVRRAVYGQVLDFMTGLAWPEDEAMKLHIIAQSLGVTVACDFLYGLFAPEDNFSENESSYSRCQADPVQAKHYQFWRGQAQRGNLQLGSFSATGGQLPLTLTRKQNLLEAFYRREKLDPSVYGFSRGQPRWRMFYNPNDILAYPARHLFHDGTVEEYRVATGWHPQRAHNGYWTNKHVQRLIAELIGDNS